MSLRAAARMTGLERTWIRRIFEDAPPGAINLGLGQPDLPTLDSCALAGVGAVVDGRTSYTATAGDAELREHVARAHAPFASGGEDVLITVGSQEALFAACMTLLDPGDTVLVPDPGYPAYPAVARLLGARAVAYPLRAERRFRLDPDDVIDRLDDATRVVILCGPANPTGAVADDADSRVLIEELERRGVGWISDEIYSGLVYERAFVSPSNHSKGGGLVIAGASKDASMTGWRVGWVVGPTEIVKRVAVAHQYLVTCAPSVSQIAARASFSPSGRAERARYLEIFRRRRALMERELRRIDGLPVTPPDGAFYYFVDVRRFGSSTDLARRALVEHGVITIPGEAFGSGGAGWLRLSFACDDDDLVEGVARLRLALATTS